MLILITIDFLIDARATTATACPMIFSRLDEIHVNGRSARSRIQLGPAVLHENDEKRRKLGCYSFEGEGEKIFARNKRGRERSSDIDFSANVSILRNMDTRRTSQ